MYHLLLVEDEDVIRRGIRSLVAQVSKEFVVAGEAAHGREALDYLDRELPDAVLTDIRMREMDGLQLIGKIRERYADIPIAVISGYGDFSYAQQAMRYGVTDYLLKPIDRVDLATALQKIQTVVERQKAQPYVAGPDTAAKPDSGDSPGSGVTRRLIRKVQQYIHAHPEGDLRLRVLADLAHVNPAYLSQLFKAETNMNVSDYIAAVRMERAKYLLGHTELRVYDVARLSGYQSPKHFMLVFKQQVGCTPSEYRERADSKHKF
ncbi:response regulator [Paenibacillus thermoaerophilus]|uniref:Response regulator n=1 Tax=Paenibacillus thermoaerophilus TaxID=1215385 RepID=A0ABW2V6A1_9BACL|nr:response regulator [Paenibacillus thermoaerophilus]TMV18841.1 response regulator [Paenibacillus thermoaerophilus]